MSFASSPKRPSNHGGSLNLHLASLRDDALLTPQVRKVNFKTARILSVPSQIFRPPSQAPIVSRVSGGLLDRWIDDFKCVTLQSLQFRICLDQFRFSQNLWRSENTRRRPTGRLLYGNEFALRGSMGKSPRHIVVLPAS